MKRFLALSLGVLLLAGATSAWARVNPSERILKFEDAPEISGVTGDLPAHVPGGYARADTFNFGYVQTIGGNLYAVQGETWTFDHGTPSLEGWYAVDVSANPDAYFKRITAADWSGHGNLVAAPIPSLTAGVWVGIYQDLADVLCWEAGLGYGNQWCQRWTGPALTYTGTGDVSLSFKYFQDSELNFDYTHVILRLQDGTEVELNGTGYTGPIGVDRANHTVSYQTAAVSAFNNQFGAQTGFRIVFEFTSDGGWSDEDANYATDFGSFGLDDVTIGGSVSGGPLTYDYESGTQGWTASTCQGFGSFFSLHPLSDYIVLDPCDCRLSGHIVAFHNASNEHPYGQRVQAFSPPAQKGPLGAAFNQVMADWDQYSVQPRANGVFFRPGWNFFPFVCPQTGNSQWSGRKGQDVWLSTGDDPNCFRTRNIATDWGVPGDANLIGFVYEIYASCDAFGIESSVCTHQTNFTPLVDNVQIRVTGVPNAPPITFEPGTDYQDGYGQGLLLSTTNAGNADITYDLHRDNPTPDFLGDSLEITGPTPTSSTKWEARMWWRMRREGPGQASVPNYIAWKTAIADGLNIVGANGQFTFGLMDSVQIGTSVSRKQFISEFREQDDDFVGEGTNNNEMIRDGILAPGTQVQYFITSDFIATSTTFYRLPDTTGGNFFEFEILPSYRNVAGVNKFPCILFVDLNTGNQFYVENALNVILNGAGPGAPIPNPTTWDRYDYDDPTSNWNAPMARSVGGNNGVPLTQLIGYRAIIVSTGRTTDGAMDNADFSLYGDWLSAIVCTGNANRQGFVGNGDNLAKLLLTTNPSFLTNYLGATLKCDAYNLANCGPAVADQSACVRLLAAGGGQYPPQIAYDAYGNWCPQKFIFDVIQAVSGGVGNRVYNDYDAAPPANTNYAQIVHSVTAANSDNYRTVLDGVSYDHESQKDVSLECVGDSAHIVTAVYNEIQAALTWIFGAGQIPGFCVDPCGGQVDVGDGASSGPVTRLYQNNPNPFNPRTSIKFSLASDGPAKLVIFDVSGRKVKTLAEGAMKAGDHQVVWDGTDDAGHKVGSGVFWSQLSSGGYESNKKMVILK